jgi:hypothetical protein
VILYSSDRTGGLQISPENAKPIPKYGDFPAQLDNHCSLEFYLHGTHEASIAMGAECEILDDYHPASFGGRR